MPEGQKFDLHYGLIGLHQTSLLPYAFTTLSAIPKLPNEHLSTRERNIKSKKLSKKKEQQAQSLNTFYGMLTPLLTHPTDTTTDLNTAIEKALTVFNAKRYLKSKYKILVINSDCKQFPGNINLELIKDALSKNVILYLPGICLDGLGADGKTIVNGAYQPYDQNTLTQNILTLFEEGETE